MDQEKQKYINENIIEKGYKKTYQIILQELNQWQWKIYHFQD